MSITINLFLLIAIAVVCLALSYSIGYAKGNENVGDFIQIALRLAKLNDETIKQNQHLIDTYYATTEKELEEARKDLEEYTIVDISERSTESINDL